MGFLEKLKTIGIDIPKIKSLISVKFTLNIDNSVKIDGSTVQINPKKFNRKQQNGLKNLLREELKESGAVLDEDFTPTVDDALKALPDVEATAKKILPIIPHSDVSLLYACLFVRKQFEAGVRGPDLKEQIARTYGPRGRNFANLVSAGYLENWFLPLYDALLLTYPGDPQAAKAQFLVLYNGIVSELPWTEFVSKRDTIDYMTRHIIEKLRRSKQNGVPYINIHGIGHANVKKILKALPEIQKHTDGPVVRRDQEQNRIFIRLQVIPKIAQ